MNKMKRPQQQATEYKSTVIIPFSKQLTKQLRRICLKYNIRCFARSQDTNSKRLSKVAPKGPKEVQVYIGETAAKMKTRLSMKNASIEKSGVVEHCLSCLCKPGFENSVILGTEIKRL